MDVPFISHEDPLPPIKQPVGRWFEPYEGGNGEWAVMVRGVLTQAERDYGLKGRLVADSFGELKRKMRVQDEMHRRFVDSQPAVPVWKHRA